MELDSNIVKFAYELPREFATSLRLKKYQYISGKSQNWFETKPSA